MAGVPARRRDGPRPRGTRRLSSPRRQEGTPKTGGKAILSRRGLGLRRQRGVGATGASERDSKLGVGGGEV